MTGRERTCARTACLWLGALALWAAAVLGYHPYSEDGGIYFAEIKKALDGRLYRAGGEFVSGHLGWSGFVTLVAWAVRVSGVPLEWLMLLLHLLCVWGVLVGVWQLATLAYRETAARCGAVGLVALCLTIPVAGTSLLLMDPYLTARAMSLALTMLGLAGLARFIVHRRKSQMAASLLLLAAAAWVHPLMGGYGIGFAAVLVCTIDERQGVRRGGLWAFAALALVAGGAVQAMGAPETPEYWRVAATRYYWFLSQWQWFERIGLIAPLAILAWVGWRGRESRLAPGLARAGVWFGLVATTVAGVFAREAARVHAVARLQPMRCLQLVYVVMLMVLGAELGRRVLRVSTWRWGLAAGVLSAGMFAVQRATYPASQHLEWPGREPTNAWEQAFVWVRANTPVDALFALDADYVHRPGEDAQGFRAIAERSVLPDYSKDGGQAAIRPELTPEWSAGQHAQEQLTDETDEDRTRRLGPFGVTWLIIGREAVTAFECPYESAVVKVCQVPIAASFGGGDVLR